MSDKKQEKKNENAVQYRPPKGISLKEIGSFIEGIYLGLQYKPGAGTGGNDLVVAVFNSLDESGLISCIVSAQIKEFLFTTNFPAGKRLKITKTGKEVLPSGFNYNLFEFDFDENTFQHDTNALLTPQQIKLLESGEVENIDQLPKQITEGEKK